MKIYMADTVEYDHVEGQKIEIEMKKTSNKYLLSHAGHDDFERIKISGEFTLTSQPLVSGKGKKKFLPEPDQPKVSSTLDRSQLALCGLTKDQKKTIEGKNKKTKRKLKREATETTENLENPAPKKKSKKSRK